MKHESNIEYISPCSLASLPEDTPLLVAFSGGADSSALLHLLYKEAQKNSVKLHAAHFNHCIRGEEAERDAEFCANIAKSYGIPFHLGRANVPELAKEHKNSIEAEARAQRYAFFEKIMEENDIPILVTAHHAEDQIESIMLHILRGSGIVGVCGMRSCRSFSDGKYLVRPLLNTEKQDILDYCEDNGIEFVCDSTNSDTGYLRNAIRANITPSMKALQPNLCEVFARLSKSAIEVNDFIDRSACEFIQKECKDNIPLNSFNTLHPALQARVLSLTFANCSDSALERIHVESIIALCKKAIPHSSISLPDEKSARIESNALIFTNDCHCDEQEDMILPFSIGEMQFCEGVTITVEKDPKEKCKPNSTSIDVNCSLITSDAVFRSRCEGDTVFSGKMNKKVKKLISEKKIPLEMRKKLPILVSNNEILWIASVAVCDRVKMDKINPGDSFFRITVKFADKTLTYSSEVIDEE